MSDTGRREFVRSPTPIEPVRKERRLSIPVDEAFRLFTDHMGAWWPLASHSIGGAQAADVRFEGRVGGHVVELTSSAEEHDWADVLVWEPPSRVVVSWHPTVDVENASTIEVRFEAEPGAAGCTSSTATGKPLARCWGSSCATATNLAGMWSWLPSRPARRSERMMGA